MAFDLTPGERVRITRPGDVGAGGAGGGGVALHLTVVNHITTADNDNAADPVTLGQTVAALVRGTVVDELNNQMRPGGVFNRVQGV
jgi:hypothetical protein